MARFNPSQVSFAGGEATPKLAGRPDTDFYKKSLALCRNIIPLPHGPALMRAGSKDTGVSGADRLIPFNVSNSEPFGLVLTNLSVRVRDHLGAPVSIFANLVTNGTFDASISGWQSSDTGLPDYTPHFTWQIGGFIRGTTGGMMSNYVGPTFLNGHAYTIRVRARGTADLKIVAGTLSSGTPTLNVTDVLTPIWQIFTHSFVHTKATGGADDLEFFCVGAGYVDVDDIFVTDDGAAAADHIVAPWTAGRLAAVQFDQDLTHNRMMLVHPNVAPQLLTLNVHGLWEMKPATLAGAPSNWSNTNWPSIIDWGFQGRLWLGASPDEPNTVNGSRSGYPFDFTTGTTAADGWNFNASVRGALRWLQGQKTLLLGAERTEQSASGGGAVVWTANVNVEDESAHGSAAIQAAHLGDEVVFVARNRREVRALSFDARTKNGWVSRALSFVAEHLVHGVKELHYAATPAPMLVLVQDDGTVVACVYNRAEDVTAWWRVELGGLVGSAAVVETTVGCELWAAVARGTDVRVEIMPLHEVGVSFLDSSVGGSIGPTYLGGMWGRMGSAWGVPPLTAVDTPYVNGAPTPPASWAVGATFTLKEANALFTGGDAIGMDMVFTAGGRLNIVSASDTSTALVKVVEEPSEAVKTGLLVSGGSLIGMTDWVLTTPTIMSGLDRLEGLTVRVIIDGSLESDQVVTGGQIPLVKEVTTSITVGLAYLATMKLLPLEGGLATGSSQSATRRWTKARLRLNNSALPLVNGIRAPERAPADPMDTGTDLVTGDVDYDDLDDSGDGALTIEQDLPFRTEVLAIFGHAQVNEV